MQVRKVYRNRSQLVVGIPSSYADAAKLERGTHVSFSVDQAGRLIIQRLVMQPVAPQAPSENTQGGQ